MTDEIILLVIVSIAALFGVWGAIVFIAKETEAFRKGENGIGLEGVKGILNLEEEESVASINPHPQIPPICYMGTSTSIHIGPPIYIGTPVPTKVIEKKEEDDDTEK